MLFFCFFVFSNWFYREVFLIATFPLIVNVYFKFNDKFSKIILHFIIFRYLFLFIYAYFNINDHIKHINGIRVFSWEFILSISLKGFFDYMLMLLIGSILIYYTKSFLKELKIKYKKIHI